MTIPTQAPADVPPARAGTIVPPFYQPNSSQPSINETEAYWKNPSIFLVPEWMKDKDSKESKAYQPELVSLGPYHHGDPNLLQMEEHKLRAVQGMLYLSQQQGLQKSQQDFFDAIKGVADTLLEAYHNLHFRWRQENRDLFIKMMVNDGCFLLEFMRAVESLNRGQSWLKEYTHNDPIFSMRGLISKYARIYSDVLVMENQIPLLVLKELLTVTNKDGPATDQMVNDKVLKFLNNGAEVFIDDEPLGMHPLDIFHRSLCGPRREIEEWHRWMDIVPCAVELGEAGIDFRKSNTNKLCSIDFKNGVLSMPQIVVRDGTKKEFLNLMAFEHLHRDIITNVSVTNFVFFMDNIIDTEADVELLKKREIIEHTLGSNMEVARLFNTINKGAMMSPYGKLAEVKGAVNEYRKKIWPSVKASFKKKYMRDTWVFVSLIVAAILLILTFVQTMYTIAPYYKKP